MVTSAQNVIIDINGLVKRYGDDVAVDNVDLRIQAGEIFGILGPNGAGKTTTLEMIEGLRKPDAGSVWVAGHDALIDSHVVRQKIGVQLQTTALFDYLSAAELIELFAGLYDVDASPTRIDELLDLVGLQDKRGARVDELSGGQKQRLSIAIGLVNDPAIAFLDEPTTGLDPGARRELWQAVRGIRDKGATVVLTTHYMEEAEVLCDRVAIMDRGRIIACDTPAALIRKLGTQATIRADVAGGDLAPERLAELAAVSGARALNGTLELQTENAQESLIALLEFAANAQVRLDDLRVTAASLEDVFLSLTGRSYKPAPDATANDPVAVPRKRWSRGSRKR